MGRDHIELDPLFRRWVAEHTRNIGFVPDRARLAELLSQADLFVQPGLCDVFNQYRFPSKVPDFFALGRPVVLPRTNIGLVTRHGEDAYVLDEANGPAIADAVKAIVPDEELRRKLSSGARRFFETNLRWPAPPPRSCALSPRPGSASHRQPLRTNKRGRLQPVQSLRPDQFSAPFLCDRPRLLR